MGKNEGVLKYLDDFPGGVCLVSRDKEERILAVNREALRIFECDSEEEFMEFTKGLFRNLMTAENYHSVEEMYSGHVVKRNYNFYHFSCEARNGESLQVEGIIGPAEDTGFGPVWVLGLVRSDTRHWALERDLDTGLMGKHAFHIEAKRLELADRAAGVFGRRVHIFINLAQFSAVNVNLGVVVGNTVLKRMGQILRKYFPHEPVAHLAADEFVILADRENVFERLEAAEEEINGILHDDSIRCKAGVVLYDEDHVPVEALDKIVAWEPFEWAKVAADSIRNDGNRSWALYMPDMGQRRIHTAFVLRNFRKALREGHIQVYYQPVIRTLTGKVCSMEALARWKDTEKGMILPGVFIPVLEKMNLIHYLDCYVIEETAKLYNKLKAEHHPIIPVSVNLSRKDFEALSPFDFMEHIVSEYQVPRHYFRIEVTESALTLNGQALKKELNRFRDAGYQLWLDDFGSGYSSLNVLKDFPFDGIKIDMAFLRNFDENSRKIIRSIILMAKNLSIHTLAEGAETQEQVDFLKEAGCEKIQGYFYGKPMPYEEVAAKIESGRYVLEDPLERSVMNGIGLVNVITDKPIGLFIGTKDRCHVLFRNEALKRENQSVTQTDEIFFKNGLMDSANPVYPFIHELIEGSRKSGKSQSATTVEGENLLRYEVHTIRGSEALCGGTFSVVNMSLKEKDSPLQKVNTLYRNMMRLYDGMYYYRDRNQTVEVLLTALPGFKSGSFMRLQEWLKAASWIHPEDRKAFLAFMDINALKKKAGTSPYNAADGVFRFKNRDGQYVWKEALALLIGENILFTTKLLMLSPYSEEEGNRLMARFISSSTRDYRSEEEKSFQVCLLNTLRRRGDFKFFWKDRNCRFLGASDAFLRYYGFPDEKSILGKTDEDMGWHLGDSSYQGEEDKVLQEGAASVNVRGHCIARGRVRTIAATKVPVYQGNDIIGLAGWFVDLNDESKKREKYSRRYYMDEESGFLSCRGFLVSAQHYDDALQAAGSDYEIILLEIPGIESFGKEYGHESRGRLVQAAGRAIRAVYGARAVIGRAGINQFLIIQNAQEKEQDKKDLDTLKEKLSRIHSVDGYPCTLFTRWAIAYSKEVKNLDDMRPILLHRLTGCTK
jgi:EAL domain-containing protein (putative c-di-GMP-specific phosphodiesterase class I)/GGDEF domain-containing protein